MTNDFDANRDTPVLDALQRALDQGDISQVRHQLTELDEHERELLRLEMGDDQVDLIYRMMQRKERGVKKGHVVVLHGIMGGTLAVKRNRDTDNVWVNFWRLLKGRIADLKLNADGGPADPDVQVLVTGQQKKYYLPMILKLDQQWNVLPFAYDWRADIAGSARQLSASIKSFAGGNPVHLVAHSMGGLVSRCMIHKYPDLWQQMADGDELVRGGRLIMLGTPNHGSFAIPLAMTGEEKQVKLLAKVDLKHDLGELLDITNTFPGSYQMLPSSLVDLGDDHRKLYDASQWGKHSIQEPLLRRGKEFHEEIEQVIDTKRFVYIAGYDKKTPHRIKVDGPGRFTYQLTRDGDGRVPHDLGLLDGVTTYWADVTHGDLARHEDILDSIDDLLETGQTNVLSTIKPASRSIADEQWQHSSSFEIIDQEAAQLLEKETRRSGIKTSQLSKKEQLRVESSLLGPFLGHTESNPRQTNPPVNKDTEGKPPKLRIEVVWGDITKTDGDVFAVGHYQGVLPQVAELALDRAISGDPKNLNPDSHVIRQHTLRGTLRGALGDVDFFPWNMEDGSSRTVVVAGMGRIGSFTPTGMRTLAHKLAWAVSGLHGVDTVCTVLIGSGEGSLTIEESLAGLSQGLADVLSGEMGETASQVRTLRVVELYRDRAKRIHKALLDNKDWFGRNLELEIPADIRRGKSAQLSPEDGLQLIYKAVLEARTHEEKQNLFNEILADASALGSVGKPQLRKALVKADQKNKRTGQKTDYYVSQNPTRGNSRVPFRLSYLTDDGDIRAAAISDTATVPERVLKFDRRLVETVSAEVMNAKLPLRDATPHFLRQLVLPQEFRELIDRGESFVFEVDRDMAQIPWEILASAGELGHENPLAIRAQVARQMRTTYSGGPTVGRRSDGNLRALVIGDPGDPNKGHNLPGAQREAFEVYDLMRSKSVDVELFIGAETGERTGRLRDFPAASRVRVMEKLMLENYQILHYCGHGSFDKDKTERAGWLFADGLLTAYELERISEVPGLVVANACLTGRVSQRAAGNDRIQRVRDEAALLPSLADEFFRRGVINYVGTAWEVSDQGAILFAKTLYVELLGKSTVTGKAAGTKIPSVGDAVLEARRTLHAKQAVYGKLWAAYQHYGDPTSPFYISM